MYMYLYLFQVQLIVSFDKKYMGKQASKNNIKLVTQKKPSSYRKQKRNILSLKMLRNMAHSSLKKSDRRNIRFSKQTDKIQDKAKILFQVNALVNDKDLQCSICKDYLLKPVLLHCGHSYCLGCADKAMPNEGICCLCRQVVYDSQFKIHKLLQTIVKKYLSSKLTQEQKLSYQEREKQFEDFQRIRRIPQDIHTGDCVDFRIKNNWTEGIILEATDKRVVVALKHNRNKQIIVQRNSRNIAKFRTFTKEKCQAIIDEPVIILQAREVTRMQNVAPQDNIYNQILQELSPIVHNLQNNRRMFEQPNFFIQSQNIFRWIDMY